jgi:hypothetical protein
MAWRFVKQPNGLLARFSEVVDQFTDGNLSVAEAVTLCITDYGMDEASASRKVQAAVEDRDSLLPSTPGNGHDRWDEALEAIRFQHGEEALATVMAEMGFAADGALKA